MEVNYMGNNNDLRQIVNKSKSDKANLTFTTFDSSACIGVLSNFFSKKSNNKFAYESENLDQYLVLYLHREKKAIFFLNALNLNRDKLDTINVNDLFMPNFIWAMIFDNNYIFQGEFFVYPKSTVRNPLIRSIVTSNGKFKSAPIVSNCKTVSKNYTSGNLKDILISLNCLISDLKSGERGKSEIVNNPKSNFFIANWCPQK